MKPKELLDKILENIPMEDDPFSKVDWKDWEFEIIALIQKTKKNWQKEAIENYLSKCNKKGIHME